MLKTLQAGACDVSQDYESRILTLQEQLERHSLMSSMTPDDFDVDYDDMFGTSYESYLRFRRCLMTHVVTSSAARRQRDWSK